MALPVLSLGNKLLPSRAAGYIGDIIPSKRVQRMRHITRTMHKRSEEIIAEKRAALQKGEQSALQLVVGGKDIMTILRKPPNVSSSIYSGTQNCNTVEANMAASEKEQLSNEEMIAQVS